MAGPTRTTAPSSPCSTPTIRSVPRPSGASLLIVSSSSPGGILQAQPPPRAYWVSRKAPGSVTRPNFSACRRTPSVTAPGAPAGWMAGAARARVTSPPEASGCLVAPPVFKTGGRRVASLPPAAATLTPVINAAGVLVHTNLGRAPLSAAARDAMLAAAGCTDVEFDLATGRRGRRGGGALDALARAVPAAGAVHVVNNNAAALVLAATALAAGREIIISRGELIEIGDGFRLPELLQSTGARIREVGTTNRTALYDYRRAVCADTAFILKVHPSNYLIQGFTASVGVAELASLGVLVVGDIGSGLLSPNPVLPDEPDADSWLRAGAALVTASGDKLLGGPQAGPPLRRPQTVSPRARPPLARALPGDQPTLGPVEATLTRPAPPLTHAMTATF